MGREGKGQNQDKQANLTFFKSLYNRVGRFGTFFDYYASAGCLRYNMGKYHISLIFVLKPKRATTPLKVHIFKKFQGAKF